jgi:biopolymer transport protein ExbB
VLGALLALGLAPCRAAAEDGNSAEADPRPMEEASTGALRQRLKRLRTRIEEAKKRLERDRERWAEQREELEQSRDQAAKRAVEAEKRRQERKQQVAAKRRAERALEKQLKALRGAWDELRRAGRQAAEQLAIHLRAVPGAAERAAQAEALARRLERSAPQEQEGAVSAVLQALGRAHEQARRLAVEEREIHTADGRKRRVELLRVGAVAFAYRTPEGAVGLALASPKQASGRRWSEDLSPAVEGALRRAFRSLVQGAPEAERLAVPLDVTQRMTPESAGADASWWGRLRAGGVVMIPLAGVAAIALLLMLERAWLLYVRNRAGVGLAREAITACQAGEADRAERLCAGRGGAVARVLEACLRRRSQSQLAMEDAIQEQLMHEQPRLQRFLSGLAILAAIAPLLGLLGTVTGIIETFGVIRATGRTEPGLMAGGISQALVTTATGLSIAVPILLVHALLRGRVRRLLSSAERHAAALLNVLAHGEDAA